MLSYGYKNTVGAVAHLFFSDPPFAPHAIKVLKEHPEVSRMCCQLTLKKVLSKHVVVKVRSNNGCFVT